MVKKIILAVVALAVVAAVGFGAYKLVGGKDNIVSQAEKISASNYQAVFLVNDQVYFGKLKDLDSTYPVLEDVYYLVVNNPSENQGAASLSGIESGDDQVAVEGQPAPEGGQPSYTLVKLGQEIHAPENKLVLNRDQILFVEDLKSDGKLVQAIMAAKQKEAGQ